MTARLIGTILIGLVLLVGVAHAATPAPIEGTALNVGDVVGFVEKIANYLLIVAGLLVVIYIVYGAIKMITSRGDSTAFGEGKKIVINALIGAAVIFGVGVIVNTIRNFAKEPTSVINGGRTPLP